MVPFAGYAMPVQYPTGILAEHKLDARARRPVRRLAHGASVFLSPAADHATTRQRPSKR